jgi:flagellar basal-body rod protein FlgC
MNLISGLDVTSSALAAHKTRLDIVAQNIANAQTTRGPDGQPYQRQIVSFAAELARQADPASPGAGALRGLRVADITTDQTPGQRVYNPQHPDAGPDGMVLMPNVNMAFEMVDLITASRAYEANLSVAKNARQMALRTLEIGK